PPREIVVDDSDPSIQYGTGWYDVDDPETELAVGNYGAIYNGTTHATTSNSSVSFPFNGTAITVFGTIIVSTNAQNETDPGPTWDCFIDGMKIGYGQDPTFPYAENNRSLCQQADLTSSPHVLTIKVQSKGQAFYLDHVTYLPASGMSFNSSVVMYQEDDPAVTYGTGWINNPDGGKMTQLPNAQVSLNFHGTSVCLFGVVTNQVAHNATFATYTIDDSSPVNFTLRGLRSPESPTNYHILIFETGTVSDGPHTLVITHGGDNTTTPLPVDYFYVTNTTSEPLTPTPSLTFSALSSPSSTSLSAERSQNKPVGAITAGIIGALVLVALVALIAVLWNQKR
ncbi:hypothetical protein B0H11DRAFT_2303033, partial [Mycena galericulata]